jgi:hypothetical protein
LGEIQNFPRGGRRWPWRRRRRPSGRGLAPLLGFAVLGVGALLYAMPTAEEAGRIDRLLASAGDRDCQDFATRWEAQSFFRRAGPGDPHRLDDDGDGLACEFNAWSICPLGLDGDQKRGGPSRARPNQEAPTGEPNGPSCSRPTREFATRSATEIVDALG